MYIWFKKFFEINWCHIQGNMDITQDVTHLAKLLYCIRSSSWYDEYICVGAHNCKTNEWGKHFLLLQKITIIEK